MQEILDKEGIFDYEQPIFEMPTEELLEEFSFRTSGNPNAIRTIKNIIWQAYTWIQDGKRDVVDGNLRSFWYADVKPVLSRMGFDTGGRSYTERLYDAFVEMVTELGLFFYGDFGFIDEHAHHRGIGKRNGHLAVFSEKHGLFPVLKEIYEAHDTSFISLGGYPSHMATEFFVHDLREKGFAGKEVVLFSIVDYDPAGYWIEQSFREQLEAFGVKVTEMHSLITQDKMAPERVVYAKYRLKNSSKTRNWVEKTGGIDGEPYGIEADAFKKHEIADTFKEKLKDLIKS